MFTEDESVILDESGQRLGAVRIKNSGIIIAQTIDDDDDDAYLHTCIEPPFNLKAESNYCAYRFLTCSSATFGLL